MGTPKHLLEEGGRTWLEMIHARLAERTEQVVISGKGQVPEHLAALPRVPDIPELMGPLAGILAVFRQFPDVSWLIAACDMPAMQTAALDWLLGYRSPGLRAILPDLEGNGMVEPFLAYYDRDCRPYLEEIAVTGALRPGRLVGYSGVITPQPPAVLRSSWQNFNAPEDLSRELRLASLERNE